MINWTIKGLQRNISDNVVTDIRYMCEVTIDGDIRRRKGRAIINGSSTDIGFIPFEELTEEIVLEWLYTNLGDEKIKVEDELTAIITKANEIITPTKKSGTPW